MSEAEPRRSVRATKGQHKALDQLDVAPEPRKRQGKRGVKKKESEEPEEIIRCVCGATEQSTDESEPWIACDKCGVWQHNVCMGMSVFTEDLPKNYYCEECAPEDHKELLDALEAGNNLWEERRHNHEEEEAEKKRRKTKRGRGKKNGDSRDETAGRSKSPESRQDGSRRESTIKAATTGKRKIRGDSPSGERVGHQKLRKVSQSHPEPRHHAPKYTPPTDLATHIGALPDGRQGTVKVLMKSLSHIINSVMKRGMIELTPGATVESTSERLGLEIERAVFDSHAGPKEYAQQCRTLAFNLKSNEDLILRVFQGVLFPNMLAIMTTDEMASRELQRENAQMKARADKQATLTDNATPRPRKISRGGDLVEDLYVDAEEEIPIAGGTTVSPRQPASPVVIKKEHSSQSPSPIHKSLGPSPDDYPRDPSTVWDGPLTMSNTANIRVRASFAGGCNLQATQGLPWTELFPHSLEIAGRIDQQKAIEYLCGLRYNDFTDIVVTSVTPAADRYRKEFNSAVQYFVSKGRYGVVSDKGVQNVRDTYLVPVIPHQDLPEFMLNFQDNLLPTERKEPLLLVVFVYRDESRPRNSAAATSPAHNKTSGIQASPTPGARTTTLPIQPAPTEHDRRMKQAEGERLAHEIVGSFLKEPTMKFLLPQAWQMSRREWEVVKEVFTADARTRSDLGHLSRMLEMRRTPHQGRQ